MITDEADQRAAWNKVDVSRSASACSDASASRVGGLNEIEEYVG